ncbi:MAG: hypothetical protein ROY82_06285 [Truepera sp.]|jgi:quercetin dioxygenase-like cupin family protein|nr:hypothetical protein [Truepera sp.]
MTNELAATFHQHYSESAHFRAEGFTATPFGRGAHLQGMVVAFEAGQFIPVHAPGVDIALVVLEGEGVLATESGDKALKPGAIAFMAAGHTRGVKATTRLITFQVVSPPPTDADHKGVREGLERGGWR